MQIKRLLFLAAIFLLIPFYDAIAQYNIDYALRCLVKLKVAKTQNLEVDDAGIIEKKYNLGSGFYISSNGLILTAAHVIHQVSDLQSTPISGIDLNVKQSFGLIVLITDEESDIALLQNPHFTARNTRNKFYIDVFNKNASLIKGKECFNLGFPNEIHNFNTIFALSRGEIYRKSINLNGHEKLPWRKNVLLINSDVTSGFSGGLVIDSHHYPVGMIIGSYRKNGQNYSIIRKIEDIRDFLEKNHVECK